MFRFSSFVSIVRSEISCCAERERRRGFGLDFETFQKKVKMPKTSTSSSIVAQSFETQIKFTDQDRIKANQSAMRVECRRLLKEATAFADDDDEAFARAYAGSEGFSVAGLWFPSKTGNVPCDVLDVFLLLCPHGASVAITASECKRDCKALRSLWEEMLRKNNSAVISLSEDRELHIVAVRHPNYSRGCGPTNGDKDVNNNDVQTTSLEATTTATMTTTTTIGKSEAEKTNKLDGKNNGTMITTTDSSSFFLGFEIPSKSVFEANYLLENSQFVVILDLDETLLQAASEGTLERAIESEQKKIIDLGEKFEKIKNGEQLIDNNNNERAAATGEETTTTTNKEELLREIRNEREACKERQKHLLEDHRMLKEYKATNHVKSDFLTHSSKNEKVTVLDKEKREFKTVERPVIRLNSKYRGGLNGYTIFTRIDPSEVHSSILVHIRPGWFGTNGLREALAGLNRTSKKKLAQVYVCTTAEKEYAMEMWRLLDREFSLIDEREVRRRVVSLHGLGPGARKSFKIAWEGNENKWPQALSLIIDDRSNVWSEKEQPHILTVHPFLPTGYIEPESNSIEKNADAAKSNSGKKDETSSAFLEREIPGKGGVLGSALTMINAARTRFFTAFRKYAKEQRTHIFHNSFTKKDQCADAEPPAANMADENNNNNNNKHDDKKEFGTPPKASESTDYPTLKHILPEIMEKEANEIVRSVLKERAGSSKIAGGAGSALDAVLAPMMRSIVENDKVKKERREKEEREKREKIQKDKMELERKELEEREAREKKEREELEEARIKQLAKQERKAKKMEEQQQQQQDKVDIEQDSAVKKKERAARAQMKKAEKEQKKMLIEIEEHKKRKESAEKKRKTKKQQKTAASTKKPKLDLEMDDETWNDTLDELHCNVCRSIEHGEKMLLCDCCDCGFHIFCLKPPLEGIPEGDDEWFCETCHKGVHLMDTVPAKHDLRLTLQELAEKTPESVMEDIIKICKIAQGLEEDDEEEFTIDVAKLDSKTLWKLRQVCDEALAQQTEKIKDEDNNVIVINDDDEDDENEGLREDSGSEFDVSDD